jgi:hypothetical protein
MPIGLSLGRRVNSEGEKIAAKQPILRTFAIRFRGTHGSLLENLPGQRTKPWGVPELHLVSFWIQASGVFEHAARDIAGIPVASIGVHGVGLERQSGEQSCGMLRSPPQGDPGSLLRANELKSDEVASRQVSFRGSEGSVDGGIDSCLARGATERVRGGLHEQPDGLPLLLFLLDDEQSSSPSRRSPGDVPERISRSVFPQLSELGPVSAESPASAFR